MGGAPNYRQIVRTIRPARICAALHDGPGWQHSGLRLIEGLSATWGGSHDLIVALEADGSLGEEMWPLVELFDADQWAKFVRTPRHLEMCDQADFDRWLNSAAEQFIGDTGTDVAAAKRSLREFVMNDPFEDGQLSDALVAEIVRRTGVATEFGEDPVVATYMADQLPDGSAVGVHHLKPLPSRVRFPQIGHFPVEIQLIAGAKWGALSPGAQQELEKAGCSVLRESVDVGVLDRLLTAAWFGPVRWWSATYPRPSGVPPSATFDDDLFFSETPFAVSSVGCAQLHQPDPGFEQHHTIIVGSEAQDFCYAVALSRIGVPAIWLPADLLNGEHGDAALRALVGGLRGARLGQNLRSGDRRIRFRSLSVPRSDVETVAQRVSDELYTALAGLVEVVDELPLPKHRIPLLGDSQHYDDRLEEPFDGDTMVRGLPPLLPSAVHSPDSWKLQWWVEVAQPETPLPARSALNGTVVAPDGPMGPSARCGRNQVSFPSHSMGLVVSGSSLAQMVVRPRLRFPDASTVFRELFNKAGFKCTESSVGRYRRLATELWGGLDSFAADLSNPGRSAILRAWIAKNPKDREAQRPAGIELRDRRYLTLDDIQNAGSLDNTDEARALIDTYLERGIVRRGYVFKCRSCLFTDWYHLADISQSFQCARCRTPNLITRPAWITPTNEPALHYDIAEVVYQALKHNCEVPIGALAMLQQQSRTFAEAPELDVHIDAQNTVELDLLVISDGRIGFGEAKTGAQLKGTAKADNRWLLNLQTICAATRADFVVFATATDNWKTSTQAHIARVFPDGGPTEVRYLRRCAVK